MARRKAISTKSASEMMYFTPDQMLWGRACAKRKATGLATLLRDLLTDDSNKVLRLHEEVVD